ncbi:MAG: dockerin type I repeat-containing protein [Planctomycetota bacterium]
MNRSRMMILLACAGTAGAAFGQDSVAPAGATNDSDAISPYTTAEQLNEYVIDLSPITSSKGKSFGIAPITKASFGAAGVMFPNNLISGNQLSRLRSSSPVPALDGPYLTWSTPGAGVNSQVNVGPTSSVNGPANGSYLGFTFTDFNGEAGNHIAGQIGYDPADPSRLYVSRAISAINSSTNGTTSSSDFVTGAIDEAGQVMLQANDFSLNGPAQISGYNHFRVDLNARDYSQLNIINGLGASDSPSTTDIIRGDDRILNSAQLVPTALGGPAMFVQTTFGDGGADSELIYENAPLNTPDTTDHRGPASEHRGTVAMLPEAFFDENDVITAAILAKDDIGPSQTTAISIWGADVTGQPTAPGQRFIHPGTILDPQAGITLFPGEFMHTGGITPFRGGVSQVALGTTLDGDLLFAAWANSLSSALSPIPDADQGSQATVLVVGKLPADGGGVEWSVAGWLSATTGTGKPYTDANGVLIGELAAQQSIGGGVVPPGTNSAPAFDSAGNLYWMQAIRDYGPNGQPDIVFPDDDIVTTAIVRANYLADADGNGNFGFDLEDIVRFQDDFFSAGTGLDYGFTFLSPNGGGGTISTSTIFSNSVTSEPLAGAVITDSTQAETLGGLIFGAEITYDVDGDGFLDGATDDQDYQALMYIQPLGGDTIVDCNENGSADADDIAQGTSNDVNSNGIPDECELTRRCGDVNADGTVNDSDFFAWVTAFIAAPPSAADLTACDVNTDGVCNDSDFFAWVTEFISTPGAQSFCPPLP